MNLIILCSDLFIHPCTMYSVITTVGGSKVRRVVGHGDLCFTFNPLCYASFGGIIFLWCQWLCPIHVMCPCACIKRLHFCSTMQPRLFNLQLSKHLNISDTSHKSLYKLNNQLIVLIYLFATKYTCTSILTHFQHNGLGNFSWRKSQSCKVHGTSAMTGTELCYLWCLILIYLVFWLRVVQ